MDTMPETPTDTLPRTKPKPPIKQKQPPTPLTQATRMQLSLVKDMEAKETTPALRCALAKSWLDLERFKREIRGIPPLKAVDVENRVIPGARKAKPTRFEPPTEAPETSAPAESSPGGEPGGK